MGLTFRVPFGIHVADIVAEVGTLTTDVTDRLRSLEVRRDASVTVALKRSSLPGCRGMSHEEVVTHDPGAVYSVFYERWQATISFASRSATVHLDADTELRGVAFDDAMKSIIAAFSMIDGGGLCLHASSVDMGGFAVAFAAPSGTGKSTAARAAVRAGATMLSEDLTALAGLGDADGGVAVCTHVVANTSGIASPVACVPLRRVYLIEQSVEDRMTCLDQTALTKALLRNTVVAMRNKYFLDYAWERAERLVDRVPMRRLALRDDSSFLELVREDLRRSDRTDQIEMERA